MARTPARSRRKNPEGQMPLGEHLRELRRRLLWAMLGIVVGAVAGWFLYPLVVEQIMAPLGELRERGQEAALNFATIGAAFDLQLRIAVFLSLFLSSPWWVYQIWAFITPGLTRKERRYALGFTFSGALLFVLGGALGWLILPHAVTILTSFTPESALNLMDARIYFTFFTRIIATFGVAFLLPLVLVALNMLGIVSGKSMLRQWRWAVLVSFTFTAIANPLPDAWSMIVMAIPLIGLYLGACALALRHDKRAAKRAVAEDAALDAALAEPASPAPQVAPQVQQVPHQAAPAPQLPPQHQFTPPAARPDHGGPG